MTKDDVYNHIVRFEGCIPHMYLDTNSHVTVGVGNMVRDEDAASRLYMVDRANNERGTAEELVDDYRAVRALKPGMRASYYSQACNLVMTPTEIRRLFHARCAEFEMQLRSVYSNYDACPPSARLALLDMAFNLGAGALNRKWPKLKEAVLTFNWTDAARHAHRPQSSTARNIATAELFTTALLVA